MSALFRRREVAPLQLYGKLPLAKDYLRLGCATGTGLAFRDWLDRGFSGASASAEQPVLAWAARFVIGGSAPLVGCAWPSSDTGGLRRFPFVQFIDRKRRVVGDDLEAGLLSCGAVWQTINGHYHAHENFVEAQDFVAALRGKTLEPEKLEVSEPENVDISAWLDALWPGEGQDGLRAAIDELAHAKRSGLPAAARLPLAWELPLRDQVRGWWTLLNTIGWLQAGNVPTLFFPQREADPGPSEEPAFLYVSAAPLRPADAAWLASAQRGHLGAGDLCGSALRVAHSQVRAENTPSLSDSLRGVLAGIPAATWSE